MSRAELLALAEGVEGLSGPCRETDAEIAVALEIGGNTIPMHGGWCAGGPAEQPFLSPAYTASLDAAMTLVPEGRLWTMDSWADGWSAGIWRPSRGWVLTPDKERKSSTPALALTAACIRARAAMENDDV